MDSVNSQAETHWTTPEICGVTEFLESSDSPTSCTPLENALSSCLLDKRNLILFSANPTLVPHLVITPPDQPHKGYWSYLHNGVEPQCSISLSVPPRYYGQDEWSRDNLHTSWRYAHCVTPEYAMAAYFSEEEGDDAELWTEYTLPVFNRRQFQSTIESAAEERLMLYHVIPSLHKKHFKAAAIMASIVAHSFRERWDSPDFAERFEKPFCWTDPAEPLLTYHRHNPLALILDSTTPCTVPHIVIEEAPPQDPWEAYANHTVSPQDCGYGYYLTVPDHHVGYVNVPESPSSSECEGGNEDTGMDGVGYEEHAEDVEIGEEGEEDLIMMTPSLLESSNLTSEDEDDVPQTPDTLPISLHPESYISDSSNANYSKPQNYGDIHNTFDDEDDGDEEDELPPFDDWYLTIMRRQQGTVTD